MYNKTNNFYDGWIVGSFIGLLTIGLIMVTSSSIMISVKYYNQSFHFLIHQVLYCILGYIVLRIIICIDIITWKKIIQFFMPCCIFLLFIILIPGIGREIHGSHRWLSIGPMNIQISELSKISIILYLSKYLTNIKYNVTIINSIKLMIVLCTTITLLILEPDFGGTVIIAGTTIIIIFLSGIKLRYYIILCTSVIIILFILAIISPYRLTRIYTFLHPWSNQFNYGYQLIQSLIAFGRGGIFGVGIGLGIQKLFYLPEPHTDFIFAILAEELGLCGVILVIFLYIILIFKGMIIGFEAYKKKLFFSAFIAYGLTCNLGLQTIFNIGVNIGLFPTKGLTLPILSYGGTSMIISFSSIAFLLRIKHENTKNLTYIFNH